MHLTHERAGGRQRRILGVEEKQHRLFRSYQEQRSLTYEAQESAEASKIRLGDSW